MRNQTIPCNWEPFWEHTWRVQNGSGQRSNFILLEKFSFWIKWKTQKLGSIWSVGNWGCLICFHLISFHLIPSHLWSSFYWFDSWHPLISTSRVSDPGKKKHYWTPSMALIPNLQNSASSSTTTSQARVLRHLLWRSLQMENKRMRQG